MIKRLLLIVVLGVSVSGCFMAPLAFVGPVTSGYSTASLIQSGVTTGANYMVKKSTGKTLYILDEPTTGLHFDDVNKLLKILHTLVDEGNTVIVIEHNLDVIKTADHIIDLGPEGGQKGGKIIFEGTPENIVKDKKSYTGKYLKKYLE